MAAAREPLGLQACDLRIGTGVHFAKAIPVEDDRVAGFEAIAFAGEHFANHVDARHHWKLAGDSRVTSKGQTIFVIDGGVGYPDRHIPW